MRPPASLPEATGAVLRAARIGAKVDRRGGSAAGLCLHRFGQRASEFRSRPGGARPFSQGAAAPLPMAELAAAGGAVLRNEFFELAIDPHTGAIRSIFDFHARRPGLAQQVAMRLAGAAGEDEAYSIMAADEIRIVPAGPVTGEVLVRGRLVDRMRAAPGRVSAIDPRHLG